MSDRELQAAIERRWDAYDAGDLTAETATDADREVMDVFLAALEAGEIRAAAPTPGGTTTANEWSVQPWVKQGILLNFGLRETLPREYGDVTYHDVLPLRDTADLREKGTRNTPDGTAIRRGAYIGNDAILMSPAFVNIGAYIGDGALIDSCDTIGSCAQLGANVKIGANSLVGGVLEPVEDAPVIIEDDVAVGAGCRITSGFRIGEGAVIAENTLLTPRIPVYDLVTEEVLYGYVPPDRRVFARYVSSSVSGHEIIPGTAYKPAAVATDMTQETLDATEREATLRS